MDAQVRQLQTLRVSAPAPIDENQEADVTIAAATTIVIDASTPMGRVQSTILDVQGEKYAERMADTAHRPHAEQPTGHLLLLLLPPPHGDVSQQQCEEGYDI